MKVRVIGPLIATVILMMATLELVSCTQVRPQTPAQRWIKTAPEHLGLRYERVKRELGGLSASPAAFAMERLGYLVWESADTLRPAPMPDNLVTLTSKLSEHSIVQPLSENLNLESTSRDEWPTSMSARDLLRIGLLLLSDGQWQDQQLVARDSVQNLMKDAQLWKAGKTKRRTTPYLAVGSKETAFLILLPKLDIALSVIAPNDGQLAEAATYADIVAVSFRPVW